METYLELQQRSREQKSPLRRSARFLPKKSCVHILFLLLRSVFFSQHFVEKCCRSVCVVNSECQVVSRVVVRNAGSRDKIASKSRGGENTGLEAGT